MRLRFLTSTPLDVARGSGTYMGITALAGALRALGHHVEIRTPRIHLPVYTAERLLFNRFLRPEPNFDLTIGFDMDGYRCADIAALKGVIADEVRSPCSPRGSAVPENSRSTPDRVALPAPGTAWDALPAESNLDLERLDSRRHAVRNLLPQQFRALPAS